MARKTKIRMLPGSGGENQVGGKPWGEVSKSTGTKPTKKQSDKIKKARKNADEEMTKREAGFKKSYSKGKTAIKRGK